MARFLALHGSRVSLKVYLKGNKVSKSQMQKGVYIVKTNKGTFKMTVK